MANYLNQLYPRIEIKEDDETKNNINNKDNSNQESLQIDIDIINNKTYLTEKKEYIKQQFFTIKKQLDEIEKKVKKVKQFKIKK